jgi:GDSL-like Lipase/Acylhydrolase family
MLLCRWKLGLASALAITAAVLTAPQSVAESRPTAVVSLGDSAMSGEGAGDYEPGTRGENGNWCHRSTKAMIHRTQLAQNTFNLACSGADSANVSLADTSHYTEGSQAARLINIARDYQVTTVLVQVGANDEPAFADTLVGCIKEWFNPFSSGCAPKLRQQWPGRLAAMQPRVQQALTDVKSAMSQAGYAAGSYSLVLTSYASPLTEKMDRIEHGPQGCPVKLNDGKYARTEAVPQFNEALRATAASAGAKFLDFSRATEGHEACSGGDNPATEWQRRVTVDPWALVYGGLDAIGIHLAQESFHPNATAHNQLGRCVTQFINSGAGTAKCLIGSDGNLNAVP